jgi:hypothetical protein
MHLKSKFKNVFYASLNFIFIQGQNEINLFHETRVNNINCIFFTIILFGDVSITYNNTHNHHYKTE